MKLELVIRGRRPQRKPKGGLLFINSSFGAEKAKCRHDHLEKEEDERGKKKRGEEGEKREKKMKGRGGW